jgi:hypothetical protein
MKCFYLNNNTREDAHCFFMVLHYVVGSDICTSTIQNRITI